MAASSTTSSSRDAGLEAGNPCKLCREFPAIQSVWSECPGKPEKPPVVVLDPSRAEDQRIILRRRLGLRQDPDEPAGREPSRFVDQVVIVIPDIGRAERGQVDQNSQGQQGAGSEPAPSPGPLSDSSGLIDPHLTDADGRPNPREILRNQYRR
jgi:hypothetical protein